VSPEVLRRYSVKSQLCDFYGNKFWFEKSEEFGACCRFDGGRAPNEISSIAMFNGKRLANGFGATPRQNDEIVRPGGGMTSFHQIEAECTSEYGSCHRRQEEQARGGRGKMRFVMA